jgi:hypothetical protein
MFMFSVHSLAAPLTAGTLTSGHSFLYVHQIASTDRHHVRRAGFHHRLVRGLDKYERRLSMLTSVSAPCVVPCDHGPLLHDLPSEFAVF